MSSNVNIQLDSSLVENLTAVALAKGKTLSEEIEYRLLMLPLEIKFPERKTVSSKLRGIIKLSEDFDYKEEIAKRTL